MGPLGVTKLNHCNHVAGVQGAPQRLHQRVIPDVTRRKTDGARVGVRKLQRHGLHRGIDRNGCLQQVGMKRQQVGAIARGSFGEYGQYVALLQALRHLVHHPQGVAARLSANEQGARAGGQRPHQRPMLHIVFGDKAAMARRVHHHNV